MFMQPASKFEILKGVPMPNKGRGPVRGTGLMSTLRKMEVGDCIKLDAPDGSGEKIRGRLAAPLSTLKKHGWRFTTRKIDGAIWVWRTV